MTNTAHLIALAACVAGIGGCQSEANAPAPTPAAASAPSSTELVARGEYLVRIAGCNDCHTPGFGDAQGKIDKKAWLVGSPLGFKGPWGSTYAPNLRLRLADMSEAQWLQFSANLHTRPPMPDYALRDMNEGDRRALYHFVRALGPAGGPAPAALPPGQNPPPPYFELVLPPPPPGSPAGAPAAPSAASG